MMHQILLVFCMLERYLKNMTERLLYVFFVCVYIGMQACMSCLLPCSNALLHPPLPFVVFPFPSLHQSLCASPMYFLCISHMYFSPLLHPLRSLAPISSLVTHTIDYVDQTGLELAQSFCFCLSSAGITGFLPPHPT